MQRDFFEQKSARRRQGPEDFRCKVAAVLECYRPVDVGTKERIRK